MRESYLFLADGFEEIEALTPVDVMRRAGMNIKTVSITNSLQVRGAHGVTINADLIYDNTLFDNPEWLILPGGMPGAQKLHDFAPLYGLLKKQVESANGLIGAICASPAVVLGQEGFLKGRKATCYPGFEDMLIDAEYKDVKVIADDKFVLGNGPATALQWALAIVKKSLGEEKANSVANQMLLYPRGRDAMDHYFG